jgi:V8-like Glu-specific endopeptidase
MSKQRIAVSLGAMWLAACAPSSGVDDIVEPKNRESIVNGQDTADYEATGVMLNGGQSHCSGTVIAARKVLTAAHCVQGFDMSQMTFGFGADANSISKQIQIAGAVAHPQFDGQALTNDVAVLTLTEDAPIAPIPLNQSMDASWVGNSVRLVGYGVSDGPSQTGGGTKRFVDVTISQVEATTLRYETTQGKSACNGDSGGPAFLEENNTLTVVGVTSYGDQNCQQYGVYTRVDAFLQFINDEVAKDPDPNNPQDPNDPQDPNQPQDPNDPNQPQDPQDPNDPQNPGCGNETFEGRCEGTTVIWCEGDHVESYDCDMGCGFNIQEGYYDCICF